MSQSQYTQPAYKVTNYAASRSPRKQPEGAATTPRRLPFTTQKREVDRAGILVAACLSGDGEVKTELKNVAAHHIPSKDADSWKSLSNTLQKTLTEIQCPYEKDMRATRPKESGLRLDNGVATQLHSGNESIELVKDNYEKDVSVYLKRGWKPARNVQGERKDVLSVTSPERFRASIPRSCQQQRSKMASTTTVSVCDIHGRREGTGSMIRSSNENRKSSTKSVIGRVLTPRHTLRTTPIKNHVMRPTSTPHRTRTEEGQISLRDLEADHVE